MAAISNRLATVFGGSGLLGQPVVRELVKAGYRVRVAVRRPDLAGAIRTAGGVGQVYPVQANVRYPDSIARVIEGSEVVVNLVGVMHDRGRNNLDAANVFGAGAIARAAKAAGVQRLIHVSAIGADAQSGSAYARSKAGGEAAVRAAFPDAIILRPSIVFGPEDQFFNRFAAMARIAPALPLIGGGHTRFQPVSAGDIGTMVALGAEGRLRAGTTYELGGPEVMTFRDILAFILKTTNRRRLLLPLPFALARLPAAILQYLPGAPLTPDQLILLQSDNVVSAAAKAEGRTLEGAGIRPNGVEAVVPGYLWRFRKTGQFERMPA